MSQYKHEKNIDFIQENENKLIDLAKKGWNRSLREYYYPPLNEPHFVFDYTHREGFYIDPEERWQITMNLANTPLFSNEQEYIEFYYIISLHEISHYQICPYDGYIDAKLLKAALKHVNQNFAPIVVNLFADLVIDKITYSKHPQLVSWELRTIYEHIKQENNLSDFSKILLALYEKILNIEISKEQLSDNYKNLVEKISKTILKEFYDESKWEKKVEKIAYYLNDLIKDTFNLVGKGLKSEKGKSLREAPGKGQSYIEIPDDILEIMDNPLESKNSDKLDKENTDKLKQKSEEFAKDVNYSEFGAPATQAGIMIEGDPLATWYRGKAKNLIQIRIYEEKPGGQVPVYPEVWRIGDPIEELDIIQSLLNSPIIIPNITTRKWAYKLGPGHFEEQEIPDLLIVLDSSGSMGWRYTAKTDQGKGPYHTALIAAFASLHYAAKRGVKFSVINFSNKADVSDWTSDFRKAEKTLLTYQGGGTVLPTKKIIKQCDKADKKVLVFIITDFGIYNWSSSKRSFLNLSKQGHKVVGFFIGSKKIPKNKFKDLLNNVSFYPVKSPKDLINLVIQEIKKYY
ncbi:MAG: hypothetical protein ACQERB_13100 [Promethearchaeati archaeon]